MNKPVPADLPIGLQLDIKAVNLIVQALVALPYQQVAVLVQNIQNQGDLQVAQYLAKQAEPEQGCSNQNLDMDAVSRT